MCVCVCTLHVHVVYTDMLVFVCFVYYEACACMCDINTMLIFLTH